MTDRSGSGFVPAFILDRFSEGLFNGTVEGSVLISDICGFTPLTHSLFSLGKSGAEQLSEILNSFFSAMIDEVQGNAGFVADFAGDAFTAIFPGDSGEAAWRTASEIRSIVPASVSTDAGTCETGIRSGIASGAVRWHIYGSGPFTYVFSGSTVRAAASAEAGASPGEIAGQAPAGSRLPWNESPASSTPPTDASLEERFVHPDYFRKKHSPEFRDVAPVFTSFEGIEDMNSFFDSVCAAAGEFGGYFNLLDSGDKGDLVFTVFGAPLSRGRNLERAISYALRLRDLYGNRLRSGLTFGRVFAGFIGSPSRGHYTVIGDRVNMAAELMAGAAPGEVCLAEELERIVPGSYRVQRTTFLSKRMGNPLPCLALEGRRTLSMARLSEHDFAGRVAELNRVEEFAEGTRSRGSTGMLVISGEAGIGKTRLLFESASRLGNIEMVYLRCDEILSKSLNPLHSYLQNLFGTLGAERSELAVELFSRNFSDLVSAPEEGSKGHYHALRLRGLEHVLKGFIGIEESPSYSELDPRSRFDSILLAFVHLLKLKSAGRRLLLVIDDFQAMDPDTFSMLSDVFGRIDADRPLLILLKRPSSKWDPLELLPEGGEPMELDLGPLAPGEGETLMEGILPLPPGDTLSAVVSGKAEGNPFFMEQMLMYLIENDMLDCTERTCELRTSGIRLPGGIMDIITARIDRLAEDVRRTVKYASVLGREFNVSVLGRMLGGAPVDLHLKSGIEERIWNRLSELHYIFRHALIRDSVYEMQLSSHLGRLHLLAAETVEELYGDDPMFSSELSHHFGMAGETERMLPYTLKAAEHAFENFRNREAVMLYGKYIDNEPDPVKKYQTVLKLGEVHELIGEWTKAMELYTEVLDHAAGSPGSGLFADALNRLGFLRHRMGDNEKALELLLRARREHERTGSEKGVAMACNNIGNTCIDLNRPEEAGTFLRKSLRMLEDIPDDSECEELKMYTCNNLGLLHQRKGELDEASDYYARSLAISERIGSRRNLAALNYGNICFLRDEFDSAEKYYRTAFRNAEEVGDRLVSRVVLNNLAAIEISRGNFEGALETFREALAAARDMNDRKGIRLLCQNIGDTMGMLGDFEGAESFFAKAAATAAELGDERAQGSVAGKLGVMRFRKGDLDGALGPLREGLEHSKATDDVQNSMEFMFYIARLLIAGSRLDEAGRLLSDMRSVPEKRLDRSRVWYIPIVELLLDRASASAEDVIHKAGSLIGRFPGTEGAAIAAHVVYEISGRAEDRDEALAAYRALYSKHPSHHYEDLISALESAGPDGSRPY